MKSKRNLSIALSLSLIISIGYLGGYGCVDNPTKTPDDDTEEINHRPIDPHTPYPVDESVDQSYRPILFWRCEDPDGDDLTFTIHLTRFHDSYAHDPIMVETDTTYAMSVDLEKNTRYDWYVEATDGKSTPATSETWTFYTGESINNPPFPAFNPDPPDYATDVEAEDVTLRWESFDPDRDPMVFDVYLEHFLVGGDTLVRYLADEYYNVGQLGEGIDWRWFVVVRDDEGGITSNYEDQWRFETEEPNNPPEAPSNPYPADNATGVPTNVTLSWDCSDPDFQQLHYDVWFGPPLMPMLVSESQYADSYEPQGLLKDTEYEWWIVARDDEGGVTQGPFWSFTTADEVFTELQVLRSIAYDYGFLIYTDMIKARFDGAYAPDGKIYPLRPDTVIVSSEPEYFGLYWLSYEEFYFYRDPGDDPFITLGNTYRFRVYPGPGIDNALEHDVVVPDCEAYITSPADFSMVSLENGFEVQWTSSCPGTGTVRLALYNEMGEKKYSTTVTNNGSHTFQPSVLSVLSGSMMISLEVYNENAGFITATGYHPESVYRAKVSSSVWLYTM